MPRKLRKTKLVNAWPEGTILHLRAGRDLLGNGLGRDADEATLRAAWDDLRDAVLAQHADHHAKGWPSRPWAWWRFEVGQEPPGVLDSPRIQAERLKAMGVLDAAETARMQVLAGQEDTP